jgi:hypothetical protein
MKCAHFSYTKKMELVYMSRLPNIYDSLSPPCYPRSLFVYSNYTVEPSHSTAVNTRQCSNCFSLESLHLLTKEDLLVCSLCGVRSIPVETPHFPRSSRKQILPRVYSSNFYKREILFKLWLDRLQGKEKRRVPMHVVSSIMELISRDKIQFINYWVIRACIKKLRLRGYYASIPQIMCRIRGSPLFRLTPSHEKQLLCLFLSLKDVYEQVLIDRVNMLHYTYVIRKLCEHMGWMKIARVIPLLKTETRIRAQDGVWKEICFLKNWNFKETEINTLPDTRSPYAIRI